VSRQDESQTTTVSLERAYLGLTRRPVSTKHSVNRTYDELSFNAFAGPSSPVVGNHESFSSTGDIAFMFDPTPPATVVSGVPRTHTLAQIENDLSRWCSNNGQLRSFVWLKLADFTRGTIDSPHVQRSQPDQYTSSYTPATTSYSVSI
jgi:hypothetical protein